MSNQIFPLNIQKCRTINQLVFYFPCPLTGHMEIAETGHWKSWVVSPPRFCSVSVLVGQCCARSILYLIPLPPPSLEAMPSLLAARHALVSECECTRYVIVYDHLDNRHGKSGGKTQQRPADWERGRGEKKEKKKKEVKEKRGGKEREKKIKLIF